MRTGRILLLALALVLTVGTTASGAARTYFHDPLTGKAHYKPSRVQFSDLDIRHIRWHGWNRRTARGTGTARLNTCTPDCGDGQIVHARVTLTMYGRHTLHGRRYYRCVKGSARGEKIRWCNTNG